MKLRTGLAAALTISLGPAALLLAGAGPAVAKNCGKVSKVSLSTASTSATSTLKATIRLSCRSSRAVRVTLSGAGLSTPTSVIVPARKSSKSVKVVTLPTATNRTARLTAKAGGVSRSDTVKVRTGCSSRISSFAGTNLYAGESGFAVLTLVCAPRSRVAVALKSADPRVRVPSTIWVAAGRRSVIVPVSATLALGDHRAVPVTATYAGQRAGSSVIVTPSLYAIYLWNNNNDVQIDIRFTGLVPAGGLPVALVSSSPLIAVPPTEYTEGGDFNLTTTGPVTVDTPVTISATLGKRTLSRTTILRAPLGPGEFSQAGIGSSAENEEGNETIYGTRPGLTYSLHLPRAAPTGGIAIEWNVLGGGSALTLSDQSGFIGEGGYDSDVSATVADVTQTTELVLQATHAGQVVSELVTIQPRILAATLPSTLAGGQTGTGTITMAGPATTDQKVGINPTGGGIEVPLSVTVPAGATSVSFPVESRPTTETFYYSVAVRRDTESLESNVLALIP